VIVIPGLVAFNQSSILPSYSGVVVTRSLWFIARA